MKLSVLQLGYAEINYVNEKMGYKYFVNEKFKIIDREYTLHRSEQIASTHNLNNVGAKVVTRCIDSASQTIYTRPGRWVGRAVLET